MASNEVVAAASAPAAQSARWSAREAGAFWVLAILLALFLFAASAPSPLYPAYQAAWHFSPVTLTFVYAVYALGALSAMLISGRVSDYVGRRPVVAIALVIQVASMAAFIEARGVEWLVAARILQGCATGISAGAISAWLLDLGSRHDPTLAGVVGSIALISGLGLGALGSALLAQFAPDPLHLVFWLLGATYVSGLIAMPFLPDAVRRRPGWLGSLVPRVGVPPAARGLFLAAAPSLVAIWAVAGLYLSLGASLAISITQDRDPVVGGLMIASLLGTAALSSFAVRTARPDRIVIRGSLVVLGGLALTLAAVALDSGPALYLGSTVAGLGFGPAFSGTFRGLARLAPPERRSALLAAIYTVIFLSFSVPAVLAGVSVTVVGLTSTTLGFGVIATVLASATTLALWRRPFAA